MQNLLYERNGIRLGADEEICQHENTEIVEEKEPTCTESGYSIKKCLVCEEEIKTEIPATDHKWKAATCTDPETCEYCGETKGDPAGHNWTCTTCGDSNPDFDEQNTEPTVQGELVEDTNPTDVSDIGTGVDTENQTETTTIATEPPADPEPGFLGNPFACGCWLYILLALVIGILTGWILSTVQYKKKMRKRRSRPYTEVDYAAPPTKTQTVATAAPVAAAPVAVAGVAAAVHQHIGARKDQQDSYGVSDLNAYGTNGVLAVVADGMGGLANGAAVSSTLVHSLLSYFRQTSGKENTADMMLDMLTQANDQINRMLQGADRSGSTLVSAIIREGRLHFLTVGDSRIYLYRKGMLLQLNREHIYQEELAVKAVNHIVPLPQVTGDRQAHALTSYLGVGRLPHIDRNYESIKLEPGDRLLLASDGVFGTLSETDMEVALQGNLGQATEMMGQMILKANMPYQDNNTALVLEYRG